MQDMTVTLLRELFRNLRAFRSLYEAEGVDLITCPDGIEVSLWDVEAAYLLVSDLPTRQRQAIELYLIDNLRERDAAATMGVSPTNPVAMYATTGLEKLVVAINGGDLFRPDRIESGAFRCRHCNEVWYYQDLYEARRLMDVLRGGHVCSGEGVCDDDAVTVGYPSAA